LNPWTLKNAVGAALMLGTVPGAAVAQTSAQPAAAVARFYAARQNGPLWFRPGSNGEAAAQLASILRRAKLEGLSIGPELAIHVDAAIVQAQSGDKGRIGAAERLVSAAWVQYVQTVSSPTPGMIFGYQPARIPNPDRILHEAANAPSLQQHVRTVSSVNPIYAQLREAAYRQAQTVGEMADPRLLANMERARSIPARGRFVLVDAANQRLWMYENGHPVDSMKVVVGTIETPTPMISSMIHYATLNPYWNVPDALIRKTVAANAVKKGPPYLKAQGYQVMSGWGPDATVIPASEVDWKAVVDGQKTVRVRQLPGADNAMGKMKFSFPNADNIYLHDTPSKELFAKSPRTFSNGCIRLEDASRFARWLLGADPVAPSPDPEQFVKLPQGVPVIITYLTALPSEGQIVFADDVYGRDATASQIAYHVVAPSTPAVTEPLKAAP
jgi:murein L,D-transpeptidase YcbB/YkuD